MDFGFPHFAGNRPSDISVHGGGWPRRGAVAPQEPNSKISNKTNFGPLFLKYGYLLPFNGLAAFFIRQVDIKALKKENV
jgi:hypothetical protein